MSVDYYKRLERGNASGASDSVLDAIADALQLDDAERAHLFDLARAATPTPARRRAAPTQRGVRPARAADARHDRLAGDRRQHARRLPGRQPARPRALRDRCSTSREQPPNTARFTFLDPAAQEFFLDWEQAAKDLVADLRSQAGRNPYDRELTDLVGELSTRSEPFRKWWAAHNVRYHQHRDASACATPSSASSS